MPSGSPSPFGPGKRRGAGVYGGTPLALPLVATVGINSLTATTVNVVGSVNPQGLSGSYWFAYGTSPQFGQSTTVQALSATTLPQTVTAGLSALSTGTQYWCSLVGQTAAGTVTSAPVTFTPATLPVVTNASQPLTSTGTPPISIPHWQFPITFTATAGLGLVEQDTLDEVFSNVQAIVNCPRGTCPELPGFGVPDLFGSLAPVDPQPIVAAIEQLEPRANEEAVSQAIGDPSAGAWQIDLSTKYSGG